VSDDALTAARAALSEAEHALAEGDAETAVARARAGLEALGDDYAPDDVEDDTTLKLLAAEDAIATGDTAGPARMLVDILGIRVDLAESKG
jgi:hypothetical protein